MPLHKNGADYKSLRNKYNNTSSAAAAAIDHSPAFQSQWHQVRPITLDFIGHRALRIAN
jgi:hypothetical protein